MAWTETSGRRPPRPIVGGEEFRFGGDLPASLLMVEVALLRCGSPPHNSAVALQLRRWEVVAKGEEDWVIVAETERRP